MNSPSSTAVPVSDSVDGTSALKLSHAEFTQSMIKQQVYELEPLTNYYFEFWAKKEAVLSNDDEGRVQLVDLFNAGGKSWLQDDLISWNVGNELESLLVKETAWTKKAIKFTTPSVFSGNIEIRLINNGASSLYLDNVRLYKATN